MDSSEQPPVATWRYVVPACVTSLVGLCGVAAVAATVLMPTAAERLLFGGGLVLLAAVIDAVDGPVARALGATSTFGRYLDAICDAIAFGFGAAACLVALAQDVPSIPADALATVTETVAAGSPVGNPVQAPSASVQVLTTWLAAGLSFAHGLALAFRLAWSASATAARAGQPAPLAGGTIAAVATGWGYVAAVDAVGAAVESSLLSWLFSVGYEILPLVVIGNVVAMLSAWPYPRPTRSMPVVWGVTLLAVLAIVVLEPACVLLMPVGFVVAAFGLPLGIGLAVLLTRRPSPETEETP